MCQFQGSEGAKESLQHCLSLDPSSWGQWRGVTIGSGEPRKDMWLSLEDQEAWRRCHLCWAWHLLAPCSQCRLGDRPEKLWCVQGHRAREVRISRTWNSQLPARSPSYTWTASFSGQLMGPAQNPGPSIYILPIALRVRGPALLQQTRKQRHLLAQEGSAALPFHWATRFQPSKLSSSLRMTNPSHFKAVLHPQPSA